MITYSKEGITFSVPIGEALLAFACTDPERHGIFGVGIDDECHLGATDGHTLVRFLGCDPGTETPPSYALSVWPRPYVVTAVKIAKATEKDVFLAWDRRGTDSKLPPFSQVVPKPGYTGTKDDLSFATPVGINPTYLGRLVKVAKACEQETVALAGHGGPGDPVLFTCKGAPRAEVVIMPFRI